MKAEKHIFIPGGAGYAGSLASERERIPAYFVLSRGRTNWSASVKEGEREWGKHKNNYQ